MPASEKVMFVSRLSLRLGLRSFGRSQVKVETVVVKLVLSPKHAQLLDIVYLVYVFSALEIMFILFAIVIELGILDSLVKAR